MIAKNVWLRKVKTESFILFNLYHRVFESAFRFLSCDEEIEKEMNNMLGLLN
jgi:hypothetical protein